MAGETMVRFKVAAWAPIGTAQTPWIWKLRAELVWRAGPPFTIPELKRVSATRQGVREWYW
jgi:hypothetical protein